MKRARKLPLWLAGSAALAVALLISLLFVLPGMINPDTLREKILADISQKTGGYRVVSGKVDIALLPRPHMVIHQVSLSFPENFTGTIESVGVYPRILPLFSGRVDIALLQAGRPELVVRIPKRATRPGKEVEGFSLRAMQEKIASVLLFAGSNTAGLVLELARGQVTVYEEEQALFSFSDIKGRSSLSPGGFAVTLNCKSSLWENLSLDGSLSAHELKSEGHIILKDFQPQAAAGYFFSPATRRLGESHVNMDLSLSSKGAGSLQASFKTTIPSAAIERSNEKAFFKDVTAEGDFTMQDDRLTITLTSLSLDSPRIFLTGNLTLDPGLPSANAALEARSADVASVRNAALILGGDSPTIRKAADILRDGLANRVSISARGSSLEDLRKPENMVIQSSLSGASLFIPGLKMEVEDAKGELLITGDLLRGKDLEARTSDGDSYVHGGALSLGLKGKDPPFHFEADMDVDLARVPPFLASVTGSMKTLEELARLEEVKGRATGRLVLGESLSSLGAKVDVSEFNCSLRYRGLPYPLELSGGPFSYEKEAASVESLSGKMGHSVFSQVSAAIDWGADSQIEVTTPAAIGISLDEVYPLLQSHKALKERFEALESIRGAIILESFDLRGTSLDPDNWRILTKGEVDNLAVHSSLLPGQFLVSKGKFEASRQNLTLMDLHASFLDASGVVSGSVGAHLGHFRKLDLSMEGSLGQETGQWISDRIHLPAELRVRPPLSVSRSHLVWEKDGNVSFSGDLALPEGPAVSMELLREPTQLIIDELTIRDDDSKASFSLAFEKEREFDLELEGALNGTTLDKLLIRNELLTGQVKGSIQAHILMDQPAKSTVRGSLHVSNLQSAWGLKIPVRVEDASLEAGGSKVYVQSARLNRQDTPLSLKGSVDFTRPEFLHLDMELEAENLDWDLLKIPGLAGLPLRGIVNIHADHFTYKGLAWSPLRAQVSLGSETADVRVMEASLCGISTPGTVRISRRGLQLDAALDARGKDLETAVECLWKKAEVMNGSFDINGKIAAQESNDPRLEDLHGDVRFAARDGRIDSLGLPARILAALDLTEVFNSPELPDFPLEAIAYNWIRSAGKIKSGKLTLEKSAMSGPSMDVVWYGDLDLVENRINLTVLLAPLVSPDQISTYLPFLHTLPPGTLAFIPVQIKGDMANPRVVPLSPSAVDSETIEYMRQTMHLPLEVISAPSVTLPGPRLPEK